MSYYIYNDNNDYYFYNKLIARMGDYIDISNNLVKNLTLNNGTTTMPEESIEALLAKCVLRTDESGYIEESENNFEKKINPYEVFKLNSNVIPKLIELGILKTSKDSIRDYNIGKSNYSEHVIQPWAIWLDYNLNPWDADIVKRILRTKSEEGLTEVESRILDYQKIIHICQERMRQLNGNV